MAAGRHHSDLFRDASVPTPAEIGIHPSGGNDSSHLGEIRAISDSITGMQK
jgi:hypothetical protein